MATTDKPLRKVIKSGPGVAVAASFTPGPSIDTTEIVLRKTTEYSCNEIVFSLAEFAKIVNLVTDGLTKCGLPQN